MDKENIIIKMEVFMMDHGNMVKSMELVLFITEMEKLHIKEIGKKNNLMVMV